MNGNLPISPELLEILRDPYAVQQNSSSDDPGQLELVHNSWLVSPETGYKYPIRDGIPVMLIEEGRRWQNTAVDDLPVPPPSPLPPQPQSSSPASAAASDNSQQMIIAAIVGAIAFFLIFKWLRRK